MIQVLIFRDQLHERISKCIELNEKMIVYNTSNA